MPFWASTPPGVLGLKVVQHARVPMDDEHTISFTVVPRRPSHPAAQLPADSPRPRRDPWFDRLSNDLGPENDFRIERGVQRANAGPDGFTGIHGIIAQDGR